MGEYFSQPASLFRNRGLPEPGIPAGYAALIERYDLPVPLPPRLTAIAQRHHPVSTASWQLLTPRHRPADTLEGQLVFAIKWEGIDLSVLAALFRAVTPGDVAAIVRAKKTGSFARRIWYLYEWLTGTELDVPTASQQLPFVRVVNPKQQVELDDGAPSIRHRVADNLPGTPLFCPMIRWTPALSAAAEKGLGTRAREIIGRTHKDLINRAAAFLLLSDSKSSFAIEGEKPSDARAARWAEAIKQAGTSALSVSELERLQRIVIGDARFVSLGLRQEGGFVGAHDRETQAPIPDHISARAEDLKSLVTGIIQYVQRAVQRRIDPVIAAAAISFGFVYVHPFVDGNGRLHRWLVHHVLAATGYNPPGVVFPISAAILRRLPEYQAVLESYSAPLLPLIEWRATRDGNVEVLNDTGDYYRYFDATAHAEFLYSAVEQTVEQDLPDEVRFLEAFDRFAKAVKRIVEMPDRKIEQLRAFLQQGGGHLSNRAREKEFAALTEDETIEIESLYAELFSSSALEMDRSERN
jgi:Fic family protein